MPAVPANDPVRVVLVRNGRPAVALENLAPQDATVVYACEQLKTYLFQMSGADMDAPAASGKIVLAVSGVSEGQISPPPPESGKR